MAQRFYFPREQTLTNLGAVGIGWKLLTYETGTTTPKATYSNVALTSANANPASGATTGNQVSDSNGRFGDIFVGNLADYKAVLKDNLDNTIWTTDPVDPKTFTLSDFDPAPVSFWGTTTGTSTAYELAADPTQSAYSSNSVFYIKFHTACGASPTLDIDDLGVLNLKKRDGAGTKTALEVSDVLASYKYAIENDGTDLVVLNPEKPMRLTAGNGGALTIASGAITVIGSRHTIDTQAAAATDDLDTINGGTDGMRLTIGCVNAARAVVIKNGTGNIINLGGDITLTNVNQRVELEYSSTLSAWLVLNLNKIIQVVNTQTGAVATGTTVMPYDDTIPQNTEGDEYFSLSITPTSATSKLKIDVVFFAEHSLATARHTAALFQDSIAGALACGNAVSISGIGSSGMISYSHYMTSGTTSSATFKVRCGGNGAGTLTFNGSGGVRRDGGIMASSITITEIKS
jgi:hypothetical protein